MDEFRMIGTMLAPPDPSEDTIERGRVALLEHAAGPARRRPAGWIAGTGLTLTAAAAAAVAVAVSQTSVPAPNTHGPPAGAVSRPGGATKAPVDMRALSGQQVLLAAATTAAATPERTGTYWHVREQFLPVDEPAGNVQDHWSRRDGTTWIQVAGDRVFQSVGGYGFSVAHDQLTLAQLRRLPTDPAALTRFVRDSLSQTRYVRGHRQGGRMPSNGMRIDPLPAYLVPSESAIALARLLYDVPAPAAVRAAAFRALAAMPGVRNLGPVAGGVALRIALPPPPPGKFDGRLPAGIDRYDLVVDPATATVRSTTNYQGTMRILLAEWTDRRPH